jgi:hypothetical protein
MMVAARNANMLGATFVCSAAKPPTLPLINKG